MFAIIFCILDSIGLIFATWFVWIKPYLKKRKSNHILDSYCKPSLPYKMNEKETKQRYLEIIKGNEKPLPKGWHKTARPFTAFIRFDGTEKCPKKEYHIHFTYEVCYNDVIQEPNAVKYIAQYIEGGHYHIVPALEAAIFKLVDGREGDARFFRVKVKPPLVMYPPRIER